MIGFDRRWCCLPLWAVVVSTILLLASIGIGLFIQIDPQTAVSINNVLAAPMVSLKGKLDGVVVALTCFGDPLPLTVICVTFVAILLLVRKQREAAIFAIAVLSSAAIAYFLKFAFGIDRPRGQAMVTTPGSSSYPSAHATCSLVAYSLMGLIASKSAKSRDCHAALSYAIVGLPSLFGIAIGLSRVYVGVHWPTDVVGGFLLALSVVIPAAFIVFGSKGS